MEGTNEQIDIDDTNGGKNMSALEHNIKSKKENAYYYAHAYKYEGDKEKDPNAQVISGPGIITGGDPVLLQTTVKTVEVLKEPKKFTKYIFYDDDKFAVMKIDLPEDCKEVTNECVEIKFGERSFDLKVNVPNGEPYFYSVKKLFQKVIPEECKTKIVKGKLIVNIRKKNEDEEWTKLSA